MNVSKFVDAKGLACPMPIVKIKKAIAEIHSGEILEVHATDKGAQKDVTAWAKSTGHEVVQTKEENDVFQFLIKKA